MLRLHRSNDELFQLDKLQSGAAFFETHVGLMVRRLVKFASCKFVLQANEEFIDKHTDWDADVSP